MKKTKNLLKMVMKILIIIFIAFCVLIHCPINLFSKEIWEEAPISTSAYCILGMVLIILLIHDIIGDDVKENEMDDATVQQKK